MSFLFYLFTSILSCLILSIRFQRLHVQILETQFSPACWNCDPTPQLKTQHWPDLRNWCIKQHTATMVPGHPHLNPCPVPIIPYPRRSRSILECVGWTGTIPLTRAWTTAECISRIIKHNFMDSNHESHLCFCLYLNNVPHFKFLLIINSLGRLKMYIILYNHQYLL